MHPSDTCNILVKSFDRTAYGGPVRSIVQILPSLLRGVEMTLRAAIGARGLGRDSRPAARRLRTRDISLSSRTRELIVHVLKPVLAQQK